jgi:hypothetical protein
MSIHVSETSIPGTLIAGSRHNTLLLKKTPKEQKEEEQREGNSINFGVFQSAKERN